MKRLLFILSFLPAFAGAQSYHFSQVYATPLLNNPALTGYMDGNYRVATNFRSQWRQGGTPYHTTTLSADFRGLQDQVPEGNTAGAGIYLINDQSMGGALQTNSAGISTAYNISLDRMTRHTVGVGFQAAYHQRRVDWTKLSYENQYGPGGYDPSLPVGENLGAQKRNFFDVNAGLVYNYELDYNAIFSGVSVYNILQHREELLDLEFRMPMRFSFVAGGQWAMGYSSTVYGSVNYQNQGSVNEVTLGAAYGYQIGTERNQEIMIGAWHRIRDAVIPYIGYYLNGFKLGLSYDYTTSRLKSGSQIRNGYELTLVYTGGLEKLGGWY